MGRSWAAFLRGQALSGLGQPREGLALMRQVLADWCVTGARVTGPFNRTLLAEAYLSGLSPSRRITPGACGVSYLRGAGALGGGAAAPRERAHALECDA